MDNRILSDRSTEQVFNDHLELALHYDVETDIERNFSPNCRLLTSFGVFDGHDGVRQAAALLKEQLVEAVFEYRTRLWHGPVAFEEWTADSRNAIVRDGSDTFLINNGRIEVMTIHYTVEQKDSETSD